MSAGWPAGNHMKTIIRTVVALAAAVGVSSCTMQQQEPPPLTGPSEFATSVSVQVTPDVLQLDGASQSVVHVFVRNEAGQPRANVALRADILVGGQVVDFGTLSARSIVTNADGRATFVYTAPAVAAESEALIDIAVTPVGTNFQNAVPQTATLRLVPTGVRVPPSDLVPSFEVAPTSPTDGQTVLFDASSSGGSIAQYRWSFGDGTTAIGRTVSHAYDSPGTYVVTLTLVDALGRSASSSRSLTVGQGTGPTAAFTSSPTNPQPGNTVHFNAEASTAGPGRHIVSYAWDFGDGTTGSGERVSHAYPLVERTYSVTLTVTDDLGRRATTTRTVSVEFPEDDGGQPAH